MRATWTQADSTLWLHCEPGHYYARMPAGWSLEKVHPAALRVAEWLLFSGIERHIAVEAYCGPGAWQPCELPQGVPPRRPGHRTALMYSGGADSTAAARLLPDETVKLYCLRDYEHYLLRGSIPIQLPPFAGLRRELAKAGAVMIPNSFEMIGLAAGLPHGFRHGFGYAVMACLLADHYDFGAVAFGSVLDEVFCEQGWNYTDIVKHPASSYHKLRRVFALAGLEFCLPCGGCSDVVTARIAAGAPWRAISCTSPDAEGNQCGVCPKCFRKLRLVDPHPERLPEPSARTIGKLQTRPLKSAMAITAACQRSNYWKHGLDEYRDVDLGFLEHVHDYALTHLVPVAMAQHIAHRLYELGIEPMLPEEERQLRTIGRVFHPAKFDPERAGVPEVPPC